MTLKQTLVIAVLFLAACNTPSDSNVAGEVTGKDTTSAKKDTSFNKDVVKATIDSLNKKYAAAMAKGDSAGVVALFTADARVMPPNATAADVARMGTLIKGVPASGITKVSFTTKELYGNGDLLTEEGVYSVGDSTKTFETGKYIALWKKVNGQWRVHRDIWNSDGPAPK